MKRVCILVVALTLTAGLAWADEPDAGTAPAAPAVAAAQAEEGGCVLPDLAGKSEEESFAALLEAGFEQRPLQAQVPVCPAASRCSSITNCGKSSPCTVTNIGPCCQPAAGGPALCCVSGSIKHEVCPCACTGSPCAFACLSQQNSRLFC